MEDWKELQRQAYQNKVDHGFNVTDVPMEFCLLYGEVGEAYQAWSRQKPDLGEPSTCWAWRKSWMLTWARRCGGKWTSTAGAATAWWTASGSAWRTGPPGKTRKQRGGPHGLTCRGEVGKRSSSQGP